LELLIGNSINNEVFADAGNDTVFGRGGQDILLGQEGNDSLHGGNQYDLLEGGAGNDRLIGNSGIDRLWGGAGNDRLFGGNGDSTGDGKHDTFVFKSAANGGGGFDIIRDFENGKDMLDLSESGYTDFADVLADATMNGAHLEINFDFSGLLRINNFSLAQFDAGDVLF